MALKVNSTGDMHRPLQTLKDLSNQASSRRYFFYKSTNSSIPRNCASGTFRPFS